MSYPDFGCYSECLTCELCPPGGGLGGLGDGNPDLFPDDLGGDGDDPAWDDFEPPEEPDDNPNWWEDLNLPEGPGFGGVDVLPTWDPWGVSVSGEF